MGKIMKGTLREGVEMPNGRKIDVCATSNGWPPDDEGNMSLNTIVEWWKFSDEEEWHESSFRSIAATIEWARMYFDISDDQLEEKMKEIKDRYGAKND